MLSGKRILLGVTGSIAAYKAVFLLRDFQKAGAEVRVIMTPSALRFISRETFTSLSRYEVAVDVFSETGGDPSVSWTRHIQWGEWADLFLIAPCTAHTLGKIVHGLADNMLTATVMAARCPLALCPVMDGGMYRSPAVNNNLDSAERLGFHLLQPEKGYLASGLEDIGRLPEPDAILQFADSILSGSQTETSDGILRGKEVLVTAGPTREYFDPVRFLSNPSSGKMGIALAEAAKQAGGHVTLLHGHTVETLPVGIENKAFESAADLFSLVKKHADADIVIMAAAVADYRPAEKEKQKIKKSGKAISLKLHRTEDILAWLGKHKRKGQVLIGFAMETENMAENARKKLSEKNTDWIVGNPVGKPNAGFESDNNEITLFSKTDSASYSGPKKLLARQIIGHIFG